MEKLADRPFNQAPFVCLLRPPNSEVRKVTLTHRFSPVHSLVIASFGSFWSFASAASADLLQILAISFAILLLTKLITALGTIRAGIKAVLDANRCGRWYHSPEDDEVRFLPAPEGDYTEPLSEPCTTVREAIFAFFSFL